MVYLPFIALSHFHLPGFSTRIYLFPVLMKKFIINISLFALLVWITNTLITWALPYSYGNDRFDQKRQHIEKNIESFNTIAIGSSRTDVAFVPNLFDSLTSSLALHSFNFGAGGTANPESYYLTENFVKNLEEKDIEYVFMELTTLRNVSFSNLTTTRSSYFFNNQNYSYAVRVINQSKDPDSHKRKITL